MNVADLERRGMEALRERALSSLRHLTTEFYTFRVREPAEILKDAKEKHQALGDAIRDYEQALAWMLEQEAA